MTYVKNFFLSICICLISTSIFAQARDAGRLVVPHGYEQYDSLRLSLFDIQFLLANGFANDTAMTVAACDSLLCTWEYSFAGPLSRPSKLLGKVKNSMEPNRLTDLTQLIKQRYYYALPFQLPMPWSPGYYWHYNNVIINPNALYHNNTYDTNDISPYTEYPASHDSVSKTYHTSRWVGGHTIVDSVLAYGNEGQPILAYSDARLADRLLRTDSNTVIPRGPGGKPDAATTFSTTLDFNIDCNDSSHIDTTGSNGRNVNDLPLLRLQILYKQGTQGDTVVGWPIQPFTPFRDATYANITGAGWYKVTDVIVTRKSYLALDSCWKKEDRLENGSSSHSWVFKQLHILLQSIPTSMRNLIYANKSDAGWWGPNDNWGSATDTARIWSFMLPDSIVNVNGHTSDNLLELRVLSTYRATVRVRGLAYEDTNADKFLYRKRIGTSDSTHSLNPLSDPVTGKSVFGGLDEATDTLVASQKAAGAPGEFLLNDTDPSTDGDHAGFSFAMFGYAEYMAGKRGIYTHYREQEYNGSIALHLRRNRLVYDGEPPSMFENQGGSLGTGYLFPDDWRASNRRSIRRTRIHSRGMSNL
jgi:hypothetical protein